MAEINNKPVSGISAKPPSIVKPQQRRSLAGGEVDRLQWRKARSHQQFQVSVFGKSGDANRESA
jgi:hypothetical protein